MILPHKTAAPFCGEPGMGATLAAVATRRQGKARPPARRRQEPAS